MQFAQGDALGAQIAGAEHVVAVAAYAHHAFIAHRQFETAGGFTQGTGAIDDAIAGRGRTWGNSA